MYIFLVPTYNTKSGRVLIHGKTKAQTTPPSKV